MPEACHHRALDAGPLRPCHRRAAGRARPDHVDARAVADDRRLPARAGLGAAFAVGLVVLGAAPGGTMANLLTHLARGDTALSVSMTAVSSLASVITVPLYLSLAIAHFDAPVDGDIGMLGIVARVFGITIVPLAIGMRVRARRTAWAIAHEPPVQGAALVAFTFVVVGAVASEWHTVTEHFA